MTTPLAGTRMYQQGKPLIAHINVIVPVYNEAENVPLIFDALQQVCTDLPYTWSLLYVDDGSTDGSAAAIAALQEEHSHVHSLELSRNFGKEVALTAGLQAVDGDAVICIDADLQHPPSLIPQFLAQWEAGAEVVIGVRDSSRSDTWFKRFGSHVFYKIINAISDVEIIPRATDFRLLDRVVVDAFKQFTERNRMTRGLVDWLGFRRTTITFRADKRRNGEATYGLFKLTRLATASIISMSLIPLRLAGFIGVAIMCFSSLLGVVMLLDRTLSWGLHFSGPAMLATLNMFLVGIVLACMGLLAFYIGHIHQETQGRPLYVVRKHRSGSPFQFAVDDADGGEKRRTKRSEPSVVSVK